MKRVRLISALLFLSFSFVVQGMVRREAVTMVPVLVTYEDAVCAALGMKCVELRPHIPNLQWTVFFEHGGKSFEFSLCMDPCCESLNYKGKCGYQFGDVEAPVLDDVVAPPVPIPGVDASMMLDVPRVSGRTCARGGCEEIACWPWRYCLRCVHSVGI